MLSEFGVEYIIHDANVDIEPVRPLESAQAACLFERFARCAEVSDARDEVGTVYHEFVGLEYCACDTGKLGEERVDVCIRTVLGGTVNMTVPLNSMRGEVGEPEWKHDAIQICPSQTAIISTYSKYGLCL